jgi:hypothetical protein
MGTPSPRTADIGQYVTYFLNQQSSTEKLSNVLMKNNGDSLVQYVRALLLEILPPVSVGVLAL